MAEKIAVILAMLLCVAMTTDAASHLRNLVKAHNQFSLDIYDKLRNMSDGNVFFGPISITTALAIAMLGTSPEAEREMISAMKLDGFVKNHPGDLHKTLRDLGKRLFTSSENCTLLSANGIFAEETHPFLKKFFDDVQMYYNAKIKEVDFMNAFEDVRKAINAWVMSKTNDKIENLIPSGAVDEATVMVIVNAIYFKGLWKMPFAPEDTTPTEFYTGQTERMCVDMMYNKSHKFNYGESKELDSKVLQLPYDCPEPDRNLSMYIILPNKLFGITELENKIMQNNNKLSDLLNDLSEKEVEVWLPKFNFSYEFELTKILKSFGMNAVFNKGSLTRMSNSTELEVSSIIHKAFVEVNEEGTEAAAATAILIGLTASFHNPVFRADHPFLFIIRDDVTKTILFMGRVMEPTQCSEMIPTILPTTPKITTTPTTTPPGSCVPGTVVEKGIELQGDGKLWCYGTYCDDEGNEIPWDEFDCKHTTEPPMTTEPLTYPTLPPKIPKTACIDNGIVYKSKTMVPPRNKCEKKCRCKNKKIKCSMRKNKACRKSDDM